MLGAMKTSCKPSVRPCAVVLVNARQYQPNVPAAKNRSSRTPATAGITKALLSHTELKRTRKGPRLIRIKSCFAGTYSIAVDRW